jgi:hypothetical protein
MNSFEFYTDSGKVVELADKEFEVVAAVPSDKAGSWEKQKYCVYDSRSGLQTSRTLTKIYNRVERNGKCSKSGE